MVEVSWQVIVGYNVSTAILIMVLILQLKDKKERERIFRHEVERLTLNSITNGYKAGFDMFLTFYEQVEARYHHLHFKDQSDENHLPLSPDGPVVPSSDELDD